MKIKVNAKIVYEFTAEITDDITTAEDALCEADFADPVFQEVCRLLDKKNIVYDSDILEVTREDTREILYEL